MWHCVISEGVIACQPARNCFKYYNLWYAVRFAWCYWEEISKFNIFRFSQPRPSACRITSRRLTATRSGGVANDWKWLWSGHNLIQLIFGLNYSSAELFEETGPRFNLKTVFPGFVISIRSWDRHIAIMGIPISVRRHLVTEKPPGILAFHIIF